MFGNYSFSTATRHPSQPSNYYTPAISPTSTPLSSRSARSSITAVSDLTTQLRDSHLSNSISYFDLSPSQSPSATPSPTSTSYPYELFPDTESGLSTSYLDVDVRALRAQRQASARLQCNARHLREISAMVERMIEKGEQCEVSVAEESDEKDGNTPEQVRYRRSSEMAGGDGCVAKNVRVRKRSIKGKSGRS